MNTNNFEKIYETDYVVMDMPDPGLLLNKKSGIIISIILSVIGILAFLDPLPLGIGLSYIITIGLGVYGISQILSYFRISSEYRNGWTLASGILLLVFTALMLWTSLGNTYGSIQMLSTLTFTIGFFTLLNSIDQITSFFLLRKSELPGTGWLLAGGILNLLLTFLLLTNPVASWMSLSMVWGIFLVLSSIALFAESVSGRRGYYSKN